MDKVYLVKYCGSSYGDYYEITIFATAKKTTATKYVTKFNRILKKWKDYYSQFEYRHVELTDFNWIKDEYVDKYYDRWSSLQNVTKCYYEEVPMR